MTLVRIIEVTWANPHLNVTLGKKKEHDKHFFYFYLWQMW